ncbi:hypothetical protein [Vibrio sp. SCSIO 43137]|uniref:hypothetical protein n=1 Tax=Vibrio sp. SCSIO 43137 TaxID=3021011 RepID=UPI0023073194|nr:hypothetical protein [Vibrio sp. SCSIO 43137]WCE32644.1 hypothetical protein PK654_19335 [Vibrio sp. SCSIO 43137]WCE32650.1 hypothetical protein PK654_19365 [Vibrio sp. SCSIO 43137]
MDINIDRVKCAIVVLLLLIFFWAGRATNSNNTAEWTVIKDLTMTLCSLGTVLIAVLALNNWKAQAKNLKIDQVLETLSPLEKIQLACSHSVLAMHMRYEEDALEWEPHAETYQDRYRKLVDEIIEHKHKIKLLRRYLSKEDYQALVGKLCLYETNITLTKQYFIHKYPDLFYDERSAFVSINNLNARALKAESEKLFREYALSLYNLQ